jgi:hypothetical protein
LIVIQESEAVADQEHVAPVATPNAPEPSGAGRLAAGGFRTYAHGATVVKEESDEPALEPGLLATIFQ